MKKFTLFSKFLCLFIFFKFLQIQTANAQTLLQEGFEEDSTGWQIVNKGSNTWDVLTGGFNSYKGDRCMYVTLNNYNKKADCWLISTPLKFKAGRKYSISFHYKNQSPWPNQLQVSVGNQHASDESGTIVWDKTFDNVSYLKGQVNYVAAETGTKYLRFHCNTPHVLTYLYFDEVTVQDVTCFEPLNISFSNPTSTSITASWDKVDNAALYEYSIFNRDTSVPKVIRTVHDNKVDLTDMPPSTSNYFYVRSRCSATDSSAWATAQFSTNYNCSTFDTLTCGTTFKDTYPGKTGLYPVTLCDQHLNGPEFFHKFIPSKNGYYKLDCFSAGGNGIALGFAYKESSLGCGNSDWNCIGIVFDYSAMTFGPLKAGVEYIIMEKSDLQARLPSNYSFKIECYNAPPPNDSCINAVTLPVFDYAPNQKGTDLTTVGATPEIFKNDYYSCGSEGSNDDDIWISFTATDNAQLFRFRNTTYTGKSKLLNINFYSKPCNVKSLIDCGRVRTAVNGYKDIVSYYFDKGKTYYARISTTGVDNGADFNLCIMKPGISKSESDSCEKGVRIVLQEKDLHAWIPLLDNSLNVIGAVSADTNKINSVDPYVFINHGQLRKDANRHFYLDRNISVIPGNKSKGSFTVRLYFTVAELNKLIKQAGSNVSSLDDINVTQADVTCSSSFIQNGSLIIPDKRGDYDEKTKYVEFKTDHLSSFFLHGGKDPLSAGTLAGSNAFAASLKLNDVKVSPNPFVNVLNIETNEKSAVKCNISITTSDGKPVRSIEKMLNAGYNKINLDLGALAHGVYLVKVETPGGVHFDKVVKQ